jgi:hypothetical protein
MTLTDHLIENGLNILLALRVETPIPERKLEVQKTIDYLRAWRDSENERGDK